MSHYQGSCLCGKVRYEVKQFQPLVGHCHCTMCQKFHGAAFATYGEVLLDDFKWLQGESELKTYTADNGTHRQFCRHCGSSMTFRSPKHQQEGIEVSLATLDTDVMLEPDAHIYVNYKSSWEKISDDLPQYGEYRDGPLINKN